MCNGSTRRRDKRKEETRKEGGRNTQKQPKKNYKLYIERNVKVCEISAMH